MVFANMGVEVVCCKFSSKRYIISSYFCLCLDHLQKREIRVTDILVLKHVINNLTVVIFVSCSGYEIEVCVLLYIYI